MKTLIIGTGVIGTIYGWALSESGVDVTHLVREGRKQKYLKGIELDIYDIRENHPENTTAKYYPKLVEDVAASDNYELIIIPTRHYQLIETIKELKNKKMSGTFLFFTGNWEGISEVDNLIPRSKYLWGFASSVGGFINNKMILCIRKDYRFGLIEGNDESKYYSVINLFKKAGFIPNEKKNIVEWLWIHHAITAGLVGTALYYGSVAEVFENHDNSILLINAVRDCLKIVQKRDVNIDNYPDAAPFLSQNIDETISKLKYSLTETTWGKRSTKQSHFNTNPRDMKLTFWDVYNTGKKLGVHTPYLDKLQFKLKID